MYGHAFEPPNTKVETLEKLQSDTLWRQELQKSLSMQSTIDSRADFCDMTPKLKVTINLGLLDQ
jgi:hypothetical protein